MDKTPGQTAHEVWNKQFKSGVMENTALAMDKVAAAVIAHVRPKIEAEARAAALEDAVKELYEPWGDWREVVSRIRCLAAVPSRHVVMPVELPDNLISISYDVFKEGLLFETFLRKAYAAMIAARKS
jgi:hypothetical protein